VAFLGIRGGIRGGNQVKDEGWGVGGEQRVERGGIAARRDSSPGFPVTTVVHGPAKRK